MGDETAVLAAFDSLDAAFGRGDVRAVLAGFVEDPDVTLWRSSEVEHAIGLVELRAFVTWAASLPGSFTVEFDERRVHVEGDVAWVNASGTGTWDDGAGTVKHMPHRVTAVFRRVDGAWLCHTRHGSQPRVVKLG